MKSSKKLQNFSLQIALFLVAIAAATVIVSKLYFRLDITEDRIYTLSKGSLAITEKLKQPVTIKFYFSGSLKNVPPVIKTYGNRVEEVLREYAGASQGKITVEVIDPKPDSDEEQWALNYGVTANPMPGGDSLFMGIVMIAGDKEGGIPYLDPRKEEFLEYDISEALVQLGAGAKQKLGILSSFPMNPEAAPQGMGPQGEKWAIVEGLSNLFEVTTIQPNVTEIPAGIGTLLIVHPKGLADGTLYAIDQFVMHGGRALIAVDPFSRIDAAFSRQMNPMMGGMPQFSSTLAKLFDAWGIEFNPSEVVGDKLAATQINTGEEELAYPYFLSLSDDNLSKNSKVTSQLKQILIAEGGALALKAGSAHKLDGILTTSEQSGMQNAMMASFQPPAEFAAQFKSDSKKRVLAGLLTGKFKSAFAGGAPADVTATRPHLAESSGENMIFIIGDVDFLHDSNAVDKMRFGQHVIMRPRNDNLNLVMNAVEFLSGNQDLISIRTSGRITRPFKKLQEIQQNAQARWKQQEEQLSSELTSLQKKLTQIQAQRTDGNRTALSPEQQMEIRKFRDQERDIRTHLRTVRKNLREDIENLGHVLLVINLMVMPLFVCCFAVFVFYRRSKLAREEKNHA
jgi:ABC-type uncharacterized transport system involved in gliding motility auxiliary subunit